MSLEAATGNYGPMEGGNQAVAVDAAATEEPGSPAHPLRIVFGVVSLVAIAHAVWIWTHRHRGAYDPDEAGYIAAALRMERNLSSFDLVGFAVSVGGTGNGVVVPLVSVPLLMIGPRDPRMAMMAQPLLLVVTAVAVAGIARRLAGPRAAVAAGLLCGVLPMMSTAAMSYWYGLGSAACLAVAVWALLTSDRCANRWIWAYGLALGAMLLARTMTLGYLPALVVAGLVVAGRDRTRLWRLTRAVALGLAVAAPWYLVNLRTTFEYLFSYGYGPRAARFGSGGPLERASFRFGRIEEALGHPTTILLYTAAAAVAVLGARRALRDAPFDRMRSGLAVAAAFVVGLLALVSTSNNGVWFELPIVGLVVALLVAIIASGPRWFSAGLTVPVAIIGVIGLLNAWWVLPYDPERLPSHYELGFREYDVRFDPTRRDEHPTAAADWDRLNRRVIAAIRPARPDEERDPVFTVSGNMQLFNTNSLTMTGELEGWTPVARVPDTEDEADMDAELTPTFDRDGVAVERVLLIARHDKILFTPDLDVERFARRARAAGWRVDRRLAMPGGGEVEILHHRASREGS